MSLVGEEEALRPEQAEALSFDAALKSPPVVPESAANSNDLPAEIAFLCDTCVDAATLRRAAQLARQWRVSPEQVLTDTGILAPTDYYKALAAHTKLPFVRLGEDQVNWPAFNQRRGAAMARAHIVPLRRPDGGLRVAVAPRGRGLRSLLHLAKRPDAAGQLGPHVHISTPRDVARSIQAGLQDDFKHNASNGLLGKTPQFCAAAGASKTQRTAALAALLIWLLAAGLALEAAAISLVLVLSATFAALALLRLFAAAAPTNGEAGVAPNHSPPHDGDLPIYTLLVPLYRERDVLPRLVMALQRLDYPAAKLDVKLIFEADDTDTIAAAKALRPPANFDFILVPPHGPRTKPKALNYALQFARGSLVAIYDAEDRPEPDQLRKAAAVFHASNENLACLQARLNFHNAGENWLTRQFATEYAALFDVMLPALSAARLPLPLGGTSNHFRRALLEAAGGWDPYNVTEDADLGMRLARLGYSCQTLASVTYEEACAGLAPWLKQRSRWLKGWVQTFIVHMRSPLALWRDLGTAGFLVFQALTIGTVASALCYPVFAGLLIWRLAQGTLFVQPADFHTLNSLALALGGFNLIFGYGTAFALAALGLKRRGLLHLSAALVTMPLYWLLISIAALRALWQFLHDPFHWEKTDHRHLAFTLPQP